MDKERYEKEKKIYSNFVEPKKGTDEKFFNYRLMTEDEVPAWCKQEVFYLKNTRKY